MFLAAAAAATPAPAPAATSGAGGGGAAPDASGSGGIDGSAPVSIFGRVVRRPEDMVPPAVRRVLTDKETMDERYLSGKRSEQVQVEWPDMDDLLTINIVVRPKSEYWKGGTYRFKLEIPSEYPHKPPKATLMEKIYHPNIDYDGNVCLDLLRKEWKPVYTLEEVVIGLEFLLMNPEGNDPLNHAVAKVYRENRALFERNVKKSMRGGVVDGQHFQSVLE